MRSSCPLARCHDSAYLGHMSSARGADEGSIMNTKTDRPIDEILASVTVAELLRTAYSLTHRMHELQTSAFYSDDVQRVRDLRAQRDLIDAEIARRCES